MVWKNFQQKPIKSCKAFPWNILKYCQQKQFKLLKKELQELSAKINFFTIIFHFSFQSVESKWYTHFITSSVNTLYFSLSNLCCDFNLVFYEFFMIFSKTIHIKSFFSSSLFHVPVKLLLNKFLFYDAIFCAFCIFIFSIIICYIAICF